MKKSTTFLLILLAIFFTSTLYLLYLNFFKVPVNTLTPQAGTIPTENLIPTAVSTSDPTSNWKTYKNSALGFEIKYPSSVEVEKEFNDQYNRSTRFKGGNLHFEVMLRETGNIPFDKYYYMDTPIKNITTLDGNVAHVHELPNGYCDGGQSCSEPSISIVAISGSDIYHIGFFGDAQLSDIENQILSTFKFTDTKQSDETVNWKTYTDSKYNYSFKYPNTETTKITNYTGYLSSISLINTETKFEDIVFSVSSTDGSLSYNRNDKNYTVTTTSVAGLDATRVSLPIGQNPPQELVFFGRGGKYYAFQFVWDGKDSKALNLFNQLISTFKFTD